MKQKYQIIRDDENKKLIIREFAELDKDVMSLLCEEEYDRKAVKAAISSGREGLSAALRTKNLYPPGIYIGKIADKVAEIYGSKDKNSEELVFDDIEFLSREIEAAEAAAKYESEAGDIDELLDVGLEDEKFEEGEDIKKIDTTLKIEDDEFADIDDET
ncbi:MAG: hypothetical protein MUD16_07045 [Desulfobacterales bacterium]|jgi:hypothetical protein|nr:hypothetical protein [Desulfobacterales bacterium]